VRGHVQLLQQELHESSAAKDELGRALTEVQGRLAKAEENESALLDYIQVMHPCLTSTFRVHVRLTARLLSRGI